MQVLGLGESRRSRGWRRQRIVAPLGADGAASGRSSGPLDGGGGRRRGARGGGRSRRLGAAGYELEVEARQEAGSGKQCQKWEGEEASNKGERRGAFGVCDRESKEIKKQPSRQPVLPRLHLWIGKAGQRDEAEKKQARPGYFVWEVGSSSGSTLTHWPPGTVALALLPAGRPAGWKNDMHCTAERSVRLCLLCPSSSWSRRDVLSCVGVWGGKRWFLFSNEVLGWMMEWRVR